MMKRIVILSSILLAGVFSIPTLAPVAVTAETVRQGSGCPYVCREEYKLCIKRKRAKCRTKLNKCLQMCPK